MGRHRMVWAAPEDWMAVLGDIERNDERSSMSARGIWTRADLIREMLQTDLRDVLASWAWLDPEDRPVAIIGLSLLSGQVQGEAEAWSYATPRLRTSGSALAYTRQCERMCGAVLREGLVRRLFAHSHVEHETSARWLRALRFHEEGVMRRFGTDGADFRLFARVA